MTDVTTGWYDAHTAEISRAYEALDPAGIHDWLQGLLPTEAGLVADISAGSGRDAAWFAALGHEVLAIEPSSSMRREGARLHTDPRIRWIPDGLPALAGTLRLGLAADVILLSGVWQHIRPADRSRAFRKLVGLLRSGGLLAITLRDGPDHDDRGTHPVSLEEVERLAREHGMQVARIHRSLDALGRAEVSWTNVALRLPDDGTGALPLLRHLVLADQKSATYKLGLLRALCRAADGSAGLARDVDESHVSLPLGLIALLWVRLYLPLTTADLPQSPLNHRGSEALGFAKTGYRSAEAGVVSVADLRVGAQFGGDAAKAVHLMLREATELITTMPATYLTYPGGGRILPVERARARAPAGAICLDAGYLWSFGAMLVPRDLWRALQRFAAWVEPALIAEWARLMRGYAAGQGRSLDEGRIASAMTWSDPDRNVGVARSIALSQLGAGKTVHCVWTGKRLDAGTLDIDHCLPWSAWPSGDLWNLMPAHRRVNQHEKRDRLPSGEMLQRSASSITDWWDAAYLGSGHPLLPGRFAEEARASLPGRDAFSIPYTSGTTGKPRGVVLPHRARVQVAFCMASEYGCYGPDDRFLAITPLFHGAGYNFAHTAVSFGGTVEIMPSFEPERTLRAMSESGATGTFMVPTLFNAIFNLEQPILDRWRKMSLKGLMSNAAPLPQRTKEVIIDYFGDGLLHELYGSTEGGIVCNLRPADQLRKQQCVGHPFMMNAVKLLDDDGQPTRPGQVGELYNNSPCLFLGYWNNPEATEAAMRDGWFSAGDLAWQDDDGCYYIVDRKKDMYISGGVNVFPREVEEFLFRLPGVADASVVGVPDEYWGEAGKAFLVMRPGATIDPDAILAACKQSLAGYKVPRHVAFIEGLPRNAAGKVLKTELRKLT